jgi:hypothetical protein
MATPQEVRSDEPTPPINVQDHRTQIRTALLHYTPLGSRSQNVLAFIKGRLLRPDDAMPALENHPAIGDATEKAGARGVKSIRLELGRYLAHAEIIFLTAPVLEEREVIAQWAFDRNDQLIQIFVDKKSALY